MPDGTSTTPLPAPRQVREESVGKGVTALVRGVPQTFSAALSAAGVRPDVAGAQREHRAYVLALEQLVDRTIAVAPDPRFPDCCFIEDTVVVAGGRALITRPGAPSRRGEVEAVAAALPAHLRVLHTPEHACIDGGDVLRVGKTLLVGRSGRTDAAGVRALRRAFEPAGFDVREVRVDGALHLKCGCTAPTNELVLLAAGFLDPRVFDDLAEVAIIPEREAYGANVVVVADKALVAQGHPRVEEVLNEHGLDPTRLNVREIAAADGSLTCLSVLIHGPEG